MGYIEAAEVLCQLQDSLVSKKLLCAAHDWQAGVYYRWSTNNVSWLPEHAREGAIHSVWQLVDGCQDADFRAQRHHFGGISENVANIIPEDRDENGDYAAVDDAEPHRQESCRMNGKTQPQDINLLPDLRAE